MAKVQRTSGGGGKWIDKKELATGDKLKIVTEADWVPNPQGGEQLVAKAKVQGKVDEPSNISINKISMNALIDSYGDDTANWRDKVLTLQVEKTMIGGKRGTAVYMIPDGFELIEDSDGYLKIVNPNAGKTEMEKNYPDDDINPDDIPF